jgi:UDPglucose 6-dehydrogenase
MRICVFGLWHLGSVTAACLAQAGHEVVGLDPDPQNIARLAASRRCSSRA